MTRHALDRMTVEEFLGWDSGDGSAYELYAGQPVAMAPPSTAHSILTSNLARHLGNALDGRHHCTVRSEAGIIAGMGMSWYQADLAVTCYPHRAEQREVIEPRLIVEVLSPSSEDEDRKVKLPAYRTIPSVEEVVLVDPRRIYCEVHRRRDDVWVHELLVDASERLRLTSVGLDMPLSETYANIDLGIETPG